MQPGDHVTTGGATLEPGTRVRLAHPPFELTLRSDLGTIVGADPVDGDIGYYIVRLDQPARFDDQVGEPEELTEIVEAADNLEVLPE